VEATYPLRMRGLVASLCVLALIGACTPRVFDAPYPETNVVVPRDDAAHDAPIEWWYWVGHVEGEDGRRHAFQLTFFEAYVPPDMRAVVPFAFLVDKGIVAHAAVTDLEAQRHVMGQRFDAYYVSGASRTELDVFVGDWRASRAADGVSHALSFTAGGYALDLVLTPEKPAALHGDPPGIQAMGPGGVSYYVSHTRMDVQGVVGGPCIWPRACPSTLVTGQAWFDHQWGDFRIDAFAGWDWFALQLDDGADVMLYLIRGDDGAYVSAAGSYVTPDGLTLALHEHEFEIVATGATWESPHTGAVYPAAWRILVPAYDVDATVLPLLADQEMDTRATTRIVYWEGAVEVLGSRPGVGFVELTNYDRIPSAPAAP
jgi:predicted secreted hydrolase